MSDKIKENENEEITAEDLDDVAGGKAFPSLREIYVPLLRPRPFEPLLYKYGGPPPKPIIPKPLTPEEQKKLEEERKKEREKKIEQILKLAREIDEDRSNR